MFPCDGAEPPRKMCEWEILHCPWYLDSDRWAVTLDTAKKAALHMMNQGLNPDQILMELKFAPATAETHGSEAMERAVQGVAPIVDKSWAKRTRKGAVKENSKEASVVSGKQSEYVFCPS